MTTIDQWFSPRGSLARGTWDAVVDDTIPGWSHTGLRVGGSGEHVLSDAAVERILIPLEGSVEIVLDDGSSITLEGRESVFAAPADSCYLGIETSALIRAEGRVAIAEAPATEKLPVQVLRGVDTPVERRGGGSATRIVRNFGLPGGGLDASKLLVCEVITPAGNWSGVPPHKHDETIQGRETRLEEIYFFELAVAEDLRQFAGQNVDPVGVFAAYDSAAGPIDVVEIVRSGDVVLVPYGYHGPAGAMPGYDMYYLNVMAGPDGGRAWKITDDPAHAWIRTTWTGETR